MTFPIPSNEATRLAALQELQILDTVSTRDFNSLVRLARDLLQVPICAISLVDQHRQWFKAIEGLDCKETSRDIAFCAHTICAAVPLIVHDAMKDDRFRGNVLVRDSPKIRFYAGIPLQLSDGIRLGSLCVMDTKPRTMTKMELERLQHLSEMAIALLRNHARSIQTSQQAKIIEEQEQRLLKNNKLLESACELGKLGAWERDIATGQLSWSEGMFSLHEMSEGTERHVAEHLNLYPEPERTRLDELSKSIEMPAEITLLALDLDGFKEINDTHGHAAGDACLRRIARRLRTALGSEFLVARTGGDEFALIWTGTEGPMPDPLIEKIFDAVRAPIKWHGHGFQLSCSIGAAARQDGCHFVADDLLHEADLALYEAKREGKNCWRLFRTELKAATIERNAVLKSAREGLSRKRFRLFFQPKVLLANGAHSGFEALLRLIAEDGSVVTPGSFSAALEDASLSNALGDFVMEAAFQQARAWIRAGVPFGNIAINLSASQLRSPRFAQQFLDRLAALELPSRLVSVEVTEGIFLSSQADVVTANCHALKEGNVSIAFDDFGTGYASLTHLRDFPVDTIKIDRSFVGGLDKGGNSLAIVNAIVGLGNNLGLDVVAEGVETQGQQEFLSAIGCRFAQGYLFGKPVSAEDAERMLLLRSQETAHKAA
jgi:diguanylate cyclase (GGDEF)-like protein